MSFISTHDPFLPSRSVSPHPYSWQTRNRWSMAQISTAGAFVVCTLALNIIYLTCRNSLNAPFLATMQGSCLFLFPPALTAVTVILFFILTRYKKEIQFQNFRTETRSRAEIETLSPLTDVDFYGQGQEQTVTAFSVSERSPYTDRKILEKLIHPVFEKTAAFFKACIVANSRAKHPTASKDEVAMRARADLKECDDIFTALWSMARNHFNDKKFASEKIQNLISAEGAVEKEKNAIQYVETVFLSPIRALLEQDPRAFSAFDELLLNIKKPSNATENITSINSLISELLKAINTTIKDPEQKRFYTIVINTFVILPKSEIHKWIVSLDAQKKDHSRNHLLVIFLCKCVLTSFKLIEHDPLVTGLNDCAKDLNETLAKKAFKLPEIHFELYLFIVQLFLPSVSCFFDTKLSEVESLAKLHIEDQKIKQILNRKAYAQDATLVSLAQEIKRLQDNSSSKGHLHESLADDHPSAVSVKQLEYKKDTRQFILYKLIFLANILSQELGYEVELVEVDENENASGSSKLQEILQTRFSPDLAIIQNLYQTLDLKKKIIIKKCQEDACLEQLTMRMECLLSNQVNRPVKLIDIPYSPTLSVEQALNGLDYTDLYNSENPQNPVDLESLKEEIQELENVGPNLSPRSQERLSVKKKELELESSILEAFKKQCLQLTAPLRTLPGIETLEKALNQSATSSSLPQYKTFVAVPREIVTSNIKGPFAFQQIKLKAEIALSVQCKTNIKLIRVLKLKSGDIDYLKLYNLVNKRNKLEIDKLVKDVDQNAKLPNHLQNGHVEKELKKQQALLEKFKAQCLEANRFLSSVSDIQKMENELNSAGNEKTPKADSFGNILFAIPVPLNDIDNPLIFLKPYQGGWLASAVWSALKVVNSTRAIEKIRWLAGFVLEKITGHPAEIPGIADNPELTPEQNVILRDSLCRLFYLFDIMIFDLVLSKNEPAKNAAKHLVENGLSKALLKTFPPIWKKKNHTPESLLQGYFDFTDDLLYDLDPDKIREMELVG